MKRLSQHLLMLLPLTFASACIDNVDAAEDETLSETESALSTSDWGISALQANTLAGAQVATVNGTTYMVYGDPYNKDMYWKKRIGWQQWSPGVLIPGQKTSDQVSLAAFNGFLYMVHVGETDTSAVWFSRFDPVTETWTPNDKLALSTDVGAPALAGFDGRLWIVGASAIDDFGHNQLWVATMTPDGIVGGPVNLRLRLTNHRPSLAVYAGKLFVSYDNNNSIYTMNHAAGVIASSWSNPAGVKSGPSGTTAAGWDAKLAVAGGYLHLVHTLPGNRPLDTFWTYWNQCNWAPEVRLNDNVVVNHPPSLTDGGAGLILTRESLYTTSTFTDAYHVNVTEYSAPPYVLKQCSAVGT